MMIPRSPIADRNSFELARFSSDRDFAGKEIPELTPRTLG